MLVCRPVAAAMQGGFAAGPKHEVRAVWLTTLQGLDWPHARATGDVARRQQQQELCQMLDALHGAGINTILLQTRVRGSVIYPSAIEPWDQALTGTTGRDPGYDPLAFAVEEAHRRGMELHAWVVTIPCFKVSQARQMGARSVLTTHPELCRRHGDTYYLDPGVPATADYLASICREITERYDIDGIHLDYIRYPEQAASFGDAATYRRYARRGEERAAWRRRNITHIVRTIYHAVHDIKPWVRVSSSPVGKYSDLARYSSRGWNARDAVHQDAQAWLSEGIHDMLFPMMYFDGDAFYPFALDWAEHSAGRTVVPGLGIYFLHPRERNWPLSVIERQVSCLRQYGLGGQCYFRAAFLTADTKGLLGYLQRGAYAHPALVPAATWIDSIAPTPPSALTLRQLSAATAVLSWSPSADNLGGGVRYNVYASATWPVDTSDPANIVATALCDTLVSLPLHAVQRQGLHLAVTAMDRCNNESAAVQATQPHVMPLPAGLLHCDSRGVHLPPVDASFVVITDMGGRRLLRARPDSIVGVRRLPAGFYRVYAISGNGRQRRTGRIGEFWKGGLTPAGSFVGSLMPSPSPSVKEDSRRSTR